MADLTEAEYTQLGDFVTFLFREWRKARIPESRADLERRVKAAVLERANAVIRRADGRCEHCGDPDKDKRIRRLEIELAQAEREIGAALTLVVRGRKTVSAEALRAALDPGYREDLKLQEAAFVNELTAQLTEWIKAEGITGHYPPDQIASRVVASIHHSRLAGWLAQGGTDYLRDMCARIKDEADLTDAQFCRARAHH